MLSESLVKDYLQYVLTKAVRALLLGQSGETWAAGPPMVGSEPYPALMDLHRRWAMEDNRTLYEMLR